MLMADPTPGSSFSASSTEKDHPRTSGPEQAICRAAARPLHGGSPLPGGVLHAAWLRAARHLHAGRRRAASVLPVCWRRA